MCLVKGCLLLYCCKPLAGKCALLGSGSSFSESRASHSGAGRRARVFLWGAREKLQVRTGMFGDMLAVY